MKQALEAMEHMHDEMCEYMCLNNLGDPFRERTTRLAILAMNALRAAIAHGEDDKQVDELKFSPVEPAKDFPSAWQAEPVAWGRWEAIGFGDEPMRLVVKEFAPDANDSNTAKWFPLYTDNPSPQEQK